jgi:GNAT superfamily N-acetyltransferase
MERLAPAHVCVRRLWPCDVEAYCLHLLRLDARARYSRFFSVVSNEVISRHARKCFGPDCLIYGYFDGGILRGAAELHLIEPGCAKYTGEAEAAFSVEQTLRRNGVGSILMERLIRAARNRGLKMVISCLPQNIAMQSLAKKFGASLHFDHGEIIGRFPRQLPTLHAILDETVDDTLSLAAAMFDVQRRIFHSSMEQGFRTAA